MDNFENDQNTNGFPPPVPPIPQPESSTKPQSIPRGTPSYQENPVVNPASTPAQSETDGLGIASMVLGIISLVACCCYGIGILLAIPGLILGLVAKKSPATGKRSGFALAGIIISAISLGLNLIWIIYSFSVLYRLISDTTVSDWDEIFKNLPNDYSMFTKR